MNTNGHETFLARIARIIANGTSLTCIRVNSRNSRQTLSLFFLFVSVRVHSWLKNKKPTAVWQWVG
jgi:hypothetical protein